MLGCDGLDFESESSVGRTSSSAIDWDIGTTVEEVSSLSNNWMGGGRLTCCFFSKEVACVVIVYSTDGETPSDCATLPTPGFLSWRRRAEKASSRNGSGVERSDGLTQACAGECLVKP